MKQSQNIIKTIQLTLLALLSLNAHATVPVEHRYLSQTPPGDTPQIFAESFFPDWIHTTPDFSQDLSQMIWPHDDKILSMTYQQGKWSQGEIAFSDPQFDFDSPIFNPTMDQLFVMASKPRIKGKMENIWLSQKHNGQWQTPVALPWNINQHHMHWQMSVATNGNLYFLTDYTGKSPLVVAKFVDGQYQDPVNLGKSINDDQQRQLGPFIAPDESYLLFSRAPDLKASDELYISLNDHGQWTEARKVLLADGQSIKGHSPKISPDGKYLFYMAWTNRQQRAHWVSTAKIAGLGLQQL